mmetsp:Transcript_60325/g.171477  ORF Transcript_60325/g.171477 Transcript_60325/m.171477 type:complete len:335 (+) Transcript_60325:329-1333(+)
MTPVASQRMPRALGPCMPQRRFQVPHRPLEEGSGAAQCPLHVGADEGVHSFEAALLLDQVLDHGLVLCVAGGGVLHLDCRELAGQGYCNVEAVVAGAHDAPAGAVEEPPHGAAPGGQAVGLEHLEEAPGSRQRQCLRVQDHAGRAAGAAVQGPVKGGLLPAAAPELLREPPLVVAQEADPVREAPPLLAGNAHRVALDGPDEVLEGRSPEVAHEEVQRPGADELCEGERQGLCQGFGHAGIEVVGRPAPDEVTEEAQKVRELVRGHSAAGAALAGRGLWVPAGQTPPEGAEPALQRCQDTRVATAQDPSKGHAEDGADAEYKGNGARPVVAQQR